MHTVIYGVLQHSIVKAMRMYKLSKPDQVKNTFLYFYGHVNRETYGMQHLLFDGQLVFRILSGPWLQSGNTLASHLRGRGSIPVKALSGKAGSCLPLVGSLQYGTLANSMYWFPLPFQLPVVI